MKRVIMLVLATLAIGTGVGFAATLGVGSDHLWAGSQTLTKGTCTLTGTTQSIDSYVDEKSPKYSFGTGTTLQTRPVSGDRR